jgi:hypothetical protein
MGIIIIIIIIIIITFSPTRFTFLLKKRASSYSPGKHVRSRKTGSNRRPLIKKQGTRKEIEVEERQRERREKQGHFLAVGLGLE